MPTVLRFLVAAADHPPTAIANHAAANAPPAHGAVVGAAIHPGARRRGAIARTGSVILGLLDRGAVGGLAERLGAGLITGQWHKVLELIERGGLCLRDEKAAGWTAHSALHIWVTVYLRRFKLDAEDNLLARKHVTILRRVAATVIFTIALATALMTFESVQQYGVSLLASAGAAGLVIGLALQPVLKNLIAGVQLAVTQPIRIWDWRRLILPLSYFIENPFQNWTRESSALIGTVMIYLDYSVPVDTVRTKVEEIAYASPLWDRKVVNVQVTDFRENVMEVRILVSASSSSRQFDIRCEVREKLIAFIQQNYPSALPRLRADIAAPGDPQRAGVISSPRLPSGS